MKTYFRSQDLWDLVNKGFAESEEDANTRESKNKDAKTLYILQQTIHPT